MHTQDAFQTSPEQSEHAEVETELKYEPKKKKKEGWKENLVSFNDRLFIHNSLGMIPSLNQSEEVAAWVRKWVNS